MAGLIKVFERQAVDLFRNVVAEIVCDLHRHPGHQPALDIGESGAGDIQDDQGEQDPGDCGKINALAGPHNLPQDAVGHFGSRVAQDFRPNNHKDRRGNRKKHHQEDTEFVLRHVPQQLFHGTFKVLRFRAGHHRAAAHRAVPSHRAAARRAGIHLAHSNSSFVSCDWAISR